MSVTTADLHTVLLRGRVQRAVAPADRRSIHPGTHAVGSGRKEILQ